MHAYIQKVPNSVQKTLAISSSVHLVIYISIADDETAVCPPTPRGVHAARRGHGRNAGDVIHFECEPEFPVYISGDEEIRCLSSGKWSGLPLMCAGRCIPIKTKQPIFMPYLN